MVPLPPKEEQRLSDIERAIKVLEGALERFTTSVGPPMFIPEAGRQRFVYAKRSSILVQVLKAVRVVSGLNALVVLLRAGYAQEMGVILRTIDDFLAEIAFLHEAHQREEPTSGQVKFVELFFAEEGLPIAQLLKALPKVARVTRRKIQASEARLLKPDDPDRAQRIVGTIATVFDRYVHGGYPAIMDLYEGGTERFRVRGMQGTPRIPEFLSQIAIYTHRALNEFAIIAGTLKMEDLHAHLIETRRWFEASPGYRDPS